MVAQPPGPGFTWLGTGGDPIPAGIAVFLGSSALGLLVASWLVDDVHVQPVGFIAAAAIFTVVLPMLVPTKKADG